MHTVSLTGAAGRPCAPPPPHVAIRRSANWPPERLAELRRLFEGDLSHQAIADRMGVAKGVVSAKIARLNWRRRETARLAGGQGPGQESLRFKRLEALGPQDCHWPTTEDADGIQLFCACRRTAGALYCKGHQARAHRRPKAWERQAIEPARGSPPRTGLGWDRFADR